LILVGSDDFFSLDMPDSLRKTARKGNVICQSGAHE
jgi:hypothetical protein